MRRILALFVAVAFILLTVPVHEFAAAGARANGALMGHIYDEDMRTPVPNVVVKLRNVATMQEYASEPTDNDGTYVIPAIEEGRYVMGVLGPGGDYNFHYSIMIKAEALAKLSVAMKPAGSPVMLQQGSASYGKKKTILDFFKSPAGILTLITAAEVTLFAFALKEGEASPVIID
ncbi:MAG TPA: carboxypeptidase regulatory-like domain-containing protein [Candidatus Aminicenantes bacterium]|nr:carboxypeptidase regulatory-like domain-containing protein [Candidatus Aminicenantes bacterium]